MDVFALNDFVKGEYEKFSRSFTKIRSTDIKEKVEDIYLDKRFWPEPLLQINPCYASGRSIQDLTKVGVLAHECNDIFKDKERSADQPDLTLNLHMHQEQAISFAKKNQSYVVTTGTGSGKSLCFFIPIIDAVIREKKAGGGAKTRAIVIYPMNALANSQAKALEQYLDPPVSPRVTYARYTGQESTGEREQIKENPPDILLTNFMMLELLMTRQNELDSKILQNCQGLQFIVLDELHTYRGRQGADVAMLMRRLRSRIGNPDSPPLCIGTSATMASKGGQSEKNEDVAHISSQIFGADIGSNAVITETLERVTNRQSKIAESGWEGLAQAVEWAASSDSDVADGRANSDFFDDPLAIWVETRIGLKNAEAKLERGKPISLEKAAAKLADDCGLLPQTCSQALREALISYSIPEKERVAGSERDSPLFAFKLHQFVAGAGRLYTTLCPEGERDVTVNGQIFNPSENKKEERLYPTHFCRNCGQEFHPVTLRQYGETKIFEKREIDDSLAEEDEEDGGADWGFLMPEPEDSGFNFSGKDEDYPDEWLEAISSGSKRLKKTYQKRRAIQYFVLPNGKTDAGSRSAWFLPGKYYFCPACRDTKTSSARDINKLSSLTAESRSSATTILVSTVLDGMNRRGTALDKQFRKFLAFTDNRQDASLQAGHFNDFIFVTMLRGAIISALRSAPSGALDEVNVGREIQKALGFLAADEFKGRAGEWLLNPGIGGEWRNEAEALLRQNLQHLFWIDQRRDWRYTNPNLEQLGLLTAHYKYLDAVAADHEAFKSSTILREVSTDKRREVLQVLYDHMRKRLAVNCPALNHFKLEELVGKSYNLIKSPWNIEEERATTALIFMTDLPKRKEVKKKDEDKLLRGTPRSAIGQKIRRKLQSSGRHLTEQEVSAVLEILLKASEKHGAVISQPSHIGGMGWRLVATNIQFRSCEALEKAELDNEYFTTLYTDIAERLQNKDPALFGFEGREHTAQVEGKLRELREMRFRYTAEDQKTLAESTPLQDFKESSRFLPTLFCSPTMELGVDISDMNMVYLRNAPPTPANYVQRSGRAGRSGQAALILTYCAAQSPHDQYFFERKTALVDGIVVPPSIDLKNRDLVESHLKAEWLASLGMELRAAGIKLDTNIKGNLALKEQKKPLRRKIREIAHDQRTAKQARRFIDTVLQVLERDYAEQPPHWFKSRHFITEDIIKKAPDGFNESFNRWRILFGAAQRVIDLANQALADYMLSSAERKAAQARKRVGEFQQDILLFEKASRNDDFYLYRYLATEGFLPGYNFPRLPLMAYVQSESDNRTQRYIQRPRFLAISEFGPRSLIYHEGRVFRVDRALLKEAGDREDGSLSTQSRALCSSCGASHDGEHPERCHVCNVPLSDAASLKDLYQIENVGTHPVYRITSNDEERRRQGFEIQTTFAFDTSSYTASMTVSDDAGDIMAVDYAQAAYISRINKGLRRRKEKSQNGFFINPKTGMLVGQPKEDDDNGNRPEQLRQLIVPLVEDRKNALLVRFNARWFSKLGKEADKILTTLQHALARGIEAVFQLEEGEILVEPTLSRNNRSALLFYESAEGGAGALSQLAYEEVSLADIARKALEIMHFKPSSFEAASKDISQLASETGVECVAGCYRCVLSYFNQPDHELIERRNKDMQKMLLRLAFSKISQSSQSDRASEADNDELPVHDEKPLLVAGEEIPMVWRKKHIAALEAERVSDELVQALEAKGVRLFVLPSDTRQKAKVIAQLKAALKG